MIVEFGAFALILALMLSVAQTGLSAVGGARRSPVLAGAGQGAAIATFVALLASFAALIYAFVTSDFSVTNVATNSHTDKPMLYKVAGAWGSHEGSMLLWCLVLTGFGAAMAVFGDSLPPRLRAYAIAVQGALGVMFLAYTVFASNPLARLLDAPIEGKDAARARPVAAGRMAVRRLPGQFDRGGRSKALSNPADCGAALLPRAWRSIRARRGSDRPALDQDR